MIRNNESSVRVYSREELLSRAKKLPSFKEIPKEYWIAGIQSKEDTFNKFDDIFVVFKGDKIVYSTNGTTNAGKASIISFEKYNPKGVAVIKTNEWYYNLWAYGTHRGIMPALIQVNPIKYYRDGDKDKMIEETGKLQEGIIGINFHTVAYTNKEVNTHKEEIGESSAGCQVVNNTADYFEILTLIRLQDRVTYCLLKEF